MVDRYTPGGVKIDGQDWNDLLDLVGALQSRLDVLDQGGSTGGGGTTPPPVEVAGWPQALGPLTALPSWTNTTQVATTGVREQPGDIPEWTATRTYELPNLPASGGDIMAAWTACFGVNGTVRDGDEVVIPAGTWTITKAINRAPYRYRIKTGNASLNASTTLVSTSTTEHGVQVWAGTVMLKGASKTAPLWIRCDGVAGRGDKNQQGMATLLLDSSNQNSTGTPLSGFRGQDILLEGARAAGFFAYNGTTDYWLNRVTVRSSLADAYHNTGGCTYGVFTDCVSDGHGDDGMAFVHYAGRDATSRVSHHMQVYRHLILPNSHGRGFANVSCREIVADQVRIVGTASAGVLIDPAETYGTSVDKVPASGTAYRRFELLGCNWGADDHGSVFMRAGSGLDTIPDGYMESFKIVDAKGNRNAVRALGGTPPAVRLSDFVFTGGKSSNPTLGGSAPTGITQQRWDETGTSTTADTTPPTIIIENPPNRSVLTGVLSGFPGSSGTVTTDSAWRPTNTYLQTLTQVFQGKAGDTRGLSRVVVRFDDTELLNQTSFDSYGSWKTPSLDTKTLTNGAHTVTAIATAANGQTTTVTRQVTVANTAQVGDQTAPTVPTGVTTTRATDTTGSASWQPSTDDVAVAGYRVSRTSRSSGSVVTTDVTTTTISWTGLSASSIYDVSAAAFDQAGNVSAGSTAVALPLYTAPPPVSPSTSAVMLMHVDPSTTAQADALRITDLNDRATGKTFAWATDAERPIVRTLASGRKVAEFLNGRALLEGSGIAGQTAMTVTLVMAQRNAVTTLRSGYVSGTPANVNDFDRTAGQWAIGSPSASGQTDLSSFNVSGTPANAGAFTGFTRALDTWFVVQVELSTNGQAPVIRVDGTVLTTSATNPTTTGTLHLDRILIGARWYDGGPRDGQQFRLGALMIHQGRLSAADQNAVRSWAAPLFGTPIP